MDPEPLSQVVVPIYLDDLRVRCTPHHVAVTGRYLGAIIAACPGLTVEEVLRYRSARSAAGAANRTINLAVQALQSCIRWGRLIGVLKKPSPLEGLRRLPQREGDAHRRRRALTDADLDRVHAITGVSVPGKDGEERELTLDDLGLLEDAVEKVRPKLVVLDPVQAYLGAEVDAHRANEVRPRLKALARIAANHGAAIIIVRHLSKGGAGTQLIHRGLGSVDFAAAARSILHVARHPDDLDDEGRRVLVHAKANLSGRAPTLGFTISPSGWTWDGVVDVRESAVQADEAMVPRRPPGRPAEARRVAEEWLRSLLAAGPRPVMEVIARAEDKDISGSTIRRAAASIGIVSTGGYRGTPASWALPSNRPPDPSKGDSENHLSEDHSDGENPGENADSHEDQRRFSEVTVREPSDRDPDVWEVA